MQGSSRIYHTESNACIGGQVRHLLRWFILSPLTIPRRRSSPFPVRQNAVECRHRSSIRLGHVSSLYSSVDRSARPPDRQAQEAYASTARVSSGSVPLCWFVCSMPVIAHSRCESQWFGNEYEQNLASGTLFSRCPITDHQLPILNRPIFHSNPRGNNHVDLEVQLNRLRRGSRQDSIH